MTGTRWRYAYASITGPAHVASQTACQDASECHLLVGHDGSPVLVAIASDGAGSASRSDAGSRLACASFVDAISSMIAGGRTPAEMTREVVLSWLASFQAQVAEIAAAEGRSSRDFACTLLGTVIDDSAAAFFQVGDGAIVVAGVSEPDEFAWLFWPQHGEYANQTTFATESNAAAHLEHAVVTAASASIGEVAIFTDGIERLVLDLAGQVVHQPFFRAVMPPLRCHPPGFSLVYSDVIGTFLRRTSVQSRSDDDKTLILATRQAPPS